MTNNFTEERMNKKSLIKKLENYRDILRSDPSNIEAHETLIHSLFLIGKLDEAFEECRNLIETKPENPSAYWILGNIYGRQIQYTEGEKYLRKALELNPNFYQAYVDLGVNLLCQQRMEEGKIEIQKGVELEPHFWRAHYNLSIAYMMQFQYKESYHEAKLAWNERRSTKTFLHLIMAYDTAYKKWSIWLAYIVILVTLIVPSIYILPLLILAVIRLLITALYLFQTKKKGEGFVIIIMVVAVILSFVMRFSH